MNAEVRKTLIGVVLLSLLVALGRILGGRLLGALGIEADGWHTLGDTLALGAAFAGLGLVSEQRYRRLERWVTSALALTMLAVAVELVTAALDPTSSGIELALGPLAIVLPTVGMQFALVSYQRRAARRTGSLLLRGNAAHTRADALVTTAIVLSAVLAGLGLPWIDRLTGIGVALAIVSSAISILRSAVRPASRTPLREGELAPQ